MSLSALQVSDGTLALVGAAIAGTRLYLGSANRKARMFLQLALIQLLIGGISEFGGAWVKDTETRLALTI